MISVVKELVTLAREAKEDWKPRLDRVCSAKRLRDRQNLPCNLGIPSEAVDGVCRTRGKNVSARKFAIW